MTTVTGRWVQLAGLLAIAAAVAGCPQPPQPGQGGVGQPELEVFPSAFRFNQTVQSDLFTISNTGAGNLTWTITTNAPWIGFSATSGSATPTAPSEIVITVDPTGFAGQSVTGQFTVATNAGTLIVPVTLDLTGGGGGTGDPALSVSPATLDFGNVDTSRTFIITNSGSGTVDFTVTESEPWITSVSPAAGTVGAQNQPVAVTIDRSSLPAGETTGTITVDAGAAGMTTVSVRVFVGANPPGLTVAPMSLDFETSTTNLSFTITNTGGGTLNWTITENAPWLDVTPGMGSTVSSNTTTLNATVDRTGLPAGEFTTDITVAAGALTETVSVRMEVADTELVVTPTTLDFGQGFDTKLITISNRGVGTVNWSIPAPSAPWLSVSPNSGSVSTDAQAVVVEVDRSLLGPGTFSTSFNVTSNAGTVTVTVNVVILVPELEIESTILDGDTGLPLTGDTGIPVVELGTSLDNSAFLVRNAGNGFLNWNIDPDSIPEWLGLSNVAGSLAEGEEQTVSVAVDREQPAGPFSALLDVVTNAGTGQIEIAMTVRGRISIGVEPTQLNLGLFENVTTFEVANFGDPDTILNFEITNDRDWLFHSPATGFSIGVPTPPPFKDFKTIDVAIDRSRLDGTGGSGTLKIFAVDEDGEPIPEDEVEPQFVTVAVEAAPLTFEQAAAQLRTPSIVRFTFMMRDVAFRTFPLDASTLPQSAFRIFEDDVPLELTETNQFLANAVPMGGLGKTRTNLLLVLDFSGSMFESVQPLGLGGPDPLQTAYIQLVEPFLDALPADFNVALSEFHDRGSPLRILSDYTQDRNATKAALSANLNITDHGSTNLFENLLDATLDVTSADGVFAQDQNAQVNGIVILSDGRVTTPPGEVQDTIDLATAARVRMFTVGFGSDINNQSLSSLATATGGHHYAMRTTPNGEPDLPDTGDNLDELATDLSRQFVLTYITLNEENSASVRVNASVDNPNDDAPPLPGTFEQTLEIGDIVGDVKLGQIGVEASPQTSGEIIARIRADYIPRNIDKFRFDLDVTAACVGTNPGGVTFTTRVVPESEGGLIESWTPDPANPAGPLSSGTFAYSTSPSTPLQNGEFGDVIEVVFPPGTPLPLTLCLTVDNTIYATDPEPKFFTFPDSILLRNQMTVAPSFPTPFVDGDTATLDANTTLDFGTATNTLDLLIKNIGGSFDRPFEPDVELTYEIQSTPQFIDISQFEGEIQSTLTPDTITVSLDRTGEPGPFLETMEVVWTAGEINQGGSVLVFLAGTILPAQMNPLTSTVDLGTDQNSGTFTIANSGQSTLEWSIDEEQLPDFAGITFTSGQTTTETDEITVSVDRGAAPAGTQDFMFDVESNGGTQTVTVEVEILDPTLTVSTNFIDMGQNSSSTTFVITNTGQSTLTWNIVRPSPEPWLSLSRTSGETTTEEDTIGISIDRTGLASGTFMETFEVQSNGGTQSITVSIDVP